MCNLTGLERLVNLFEKEWQEKYDAAEPQEQNTEQPEARMFTIPSVQDEVQC
jgi:hypothetical protein